MFHFVREADDSDILEELLNNSESNPTKSKAETVYKPAYKTNGGKHQLYKNKFPLLQKLFEKSGHYWGVLIIS